MLSPRYPAAVVAGNVETVAGGDRRAVRRARRARLGAGDDEQPDLRRRDATSITRRSAPARRPGPASTARAAVHTHMTNSRLTDPEVLESRFPVVLEDFHIRRGSGGKGRWNAGDGTLRRIRFREPMDARACSPATARVAELRHGRRRARANSAAIPCAATTAASRSCRAARRPWSRRARRSRS